MQPSVLNPGSPISLTTCGSLHELLLLSDYSAVDLRGTVSKAKRLSVTRPSNGGLMLVAEPCPRLSK